MQISTFSSIIEFILENRLYCFFIDEKPKNISTYFLYKEFFSRINAILMFSPIDTRIIDENVDTAYRNSINNSQLLMKMSILRIEICINNLCIDGIKHQYCVIILVVTTTDTDMAGELKSIATELYRKVNG